MRLQQITEDKQISEATSRVVDQLDAAIMLELFGGLGAIGSAAGRAVGAGAQAIGNKIQQGAQAVGDKVQQGVQNVKQTYNQGEVNALLQQYEEYKQKLLQLLQQSAPRQERQEPSMQFNSVQYEEELLAELFGGLGAVFGAGANKVRQGAQAIGNRVQQGAQAIGNKVQQGAENVRSTYIKGEATALLKKMAEIGKALRARGYAVSTTKIAEYNKLKKMAGL